MRLYLSGYGGFCGRTHCLILPTWNHLWFVAYLFVYTLVLWLLLRLWPRALERIARGAGTGCCAARRSSGCRSPCWRAADRLFDRFPATHALVGDWYLHAIYLGVFLVGAAWARGGTPRGSAARSCVGRPSRWQGAWAVMLAVSRHATGHGAESDGCGWRGRRSRDAVVQPSSPRCGFAKVHLNRDHRWRATLADSVFPVYIVHQTLIVGFGDGVGAAALGAGCRRRRCWRR